MEKFWKVFCLIAYRLGIFLGVLIISPLFIIVGIIIAVAALFGAYDYDDDFKVYDMHENITDDEWTIYEEI